MGNHWLSVWCVLHFGRFMNCPYGGSYLFLRCPFCLCVLFIEADDQWSPLRSYLFRVVRFVSAFCLLRRTTNGRAPTAGCICFYVVRLVCAKVRRGVIGRQNLYGWIFFIFIYTIFLGAFIANYMLGINFPFYFLLIIEMRARLCYHYSIGRRKIMPKGENYV